jgi:Holliday junction resolvasome RuvABC endonuclease subunit
MNLKDKLRSTKNVGSIPAGDTADFKGLTEQRGQKGDKPAAIGLDLATTTGWSSTASGVVQSGTISFKGSRFEGGGMRFLRFRRWLRELLEIEKPEVIYYEEVRRHMSTDAAHIHGGLLAVLQSEAEDKGIPYLGIPVGTIKKTATGKGNATKAMMVKAARAQWPDQTITDDNQADALWILATGLAQ